MFKDNPAVSLERPMLNPHLIQVINDRSLFHDDVHVAFPENGPHRFRWLDMGPIGDDLILRKVVAQDLAAWMKEVGCEPDVILAPNTGGNFDITATLGRLVNARKAILEVKDSGAFGDELINGFIEPDDKVFIYNSVSQSGGCVGALMTKIVENISATVVGRGTFAIGAAGAQMIVRDFLDQPFYTAVEIDFPIHKPEECPKCQAGDQVVSWKNLSAARASAG